MKWLLAILAVLVLVEAGAGFCQSAHAAGPASRVQNHASDDGGAPPCHEAALSHHESDGSAASGHECGGGAACLDCVLLTAMLGETPQPPAAPEPGLERAFEPLAGPDLVFGFDPPPPKG